MSIIEGITGGGSWSSHRTLRAFPRGPGWRSRGRGVLKPTLWELALLATIPFGVGAARFVIPRAISLAQKPLFWIGVNAYQEGQDIAAWVRGEDMSLQLAWKGRPIRGPHPMYGPIVIPVAFPYLDFTKSPSSGVGGPGEIPNLHRPPPSIEETGKLISNPPMVGDVPSSPRTTSSSTTLSGKRRKSCPPGYRWNGRRCVRKG